MRPSSSATSPEPRRPHIAALRFLRENAGAASIELAVNVALPYVVYVYASPHIGDVRALLASSIPPIAWSVVGLIRKRRVDMVSVFVVAGIALSLLAFAGGGSVRFLQLRENLVSGLFGVAFLASAAMGKPLIYELARASMRRMSAAKAESFEPLGTNAHVRASMTVMTLVWGWGLLVQTAVACALVFALPIATYLIVSPLLGYGTLAALALWTWSYVKRRQRAGARAAARAGNGDTG